MPPGREASASAKATAIRSYAAGTSEIRWTVAPLLKFCQYPVSTCFGRLPPGLVGPVVVVPEAEAPYGEQLPLGSHARTLKLYVVVGLSPVAVQLVTLPTLCGASLPRTTS